MGISCSCMADGERVGYICRNHVVIRCFIHVFSSLVIQSSVISMAFLPSVSSHVAPGDSRPLVTPLAVSPGPAVEAKMLQPQTFQVTDRSGRLHRAGTALYFMSGPGAPYYFAINFIPYRTMSQRQRYLSFWHLSASVAQIKHDSLIPKSVLKRLGLHKQLSPTQSRHLAFMLDLKCLSNAHLFPQG